SLLIVVKKVVGNYAKKMSEQVTNFKEIIVNVSEKYKIEATLTADSEYSSNSTNSNLFFALDQALSEVLNKAK
ncbi:MAG: hypothetical protein V1815_02325, partial [Candidatus Woesearchaeota archaeon]